MDTITTIQLFIYFLVTLFILLTETSKKESPLTLLYTITYCFLILYLYNNTTTFHAEYFIVPSVVIAITGITKTIIGYYQKT